MNVFQFYETFLFVYFEDNIKNDSIYIIQTLRVDTGLVSNHLLYRNVWVQTKHWGKMCPVSQFGSFFKLKISHSYQENSILFFSLFQTYFLWLHKVKICVKISGSKLSNSRKRMNQHKTHFLFLYFYVLQLRNLSDLFLINMSRSNNLILYRKFLMIIFLHLCNY